MLVVTDLEKLKDYGFTEEDKYYEKTIEDQYGNRVSYLVSVKTRVLEISTDDVCEYVELDNTIYDMIKDKVLIKKEE